MLEVQENHHLKIVVFSAEKYLRGKGQRLYEYMYPRLEKMGGVGSAKFVENLWIQMGRYPSDLGKAEARVLQTYQCG